MNEANRTARIERSKLISNKANRNRTPGTMPQVQRVVSKIVTKFDLAVNARIKANALAGLTTNVKKIRAAINDELGHRAPKSMKNRTFERVAKTVLKDPRIVDHATEVAA